MHMTILRFDEKRMIQLRFFPTFFICKICSDEIKTLSIKLCHLDGWAADITVLEFKKTYISHINVILSNDRPI